VFVKALFNYTTETLSYVYVNLSTHIHKILFYKTEVTILSGHH